MTCQTSSHLDFDTSDNSFRCVIVFFQTRMSASYKKKKRGRVSSKANAVETESEPESDFCKFMRCLKEPVKTSEEKEQHMLLFKINKIKSEIENLKQNQLIQSQRKVNLQLGIEVLQAKFDKLTAEMQTQPADIPSSGNTKESINIKNVIYNNCQNLPETGKQSTDETKKSDANIVYIASQLLSIVSDKMNTNLTTQIDSMKSLTNNLLKNQVENSQSGNPIVSENKIENVQSKVVPPSARPSILFPNSQDSDKAQASTCSSEEIRSKRDHLKFGFPEIKVKILEYLCGKVKANAAVTTFRRLQRAKAFSMLKQTFDSDHNKLLRIYLFDDGNILVQDMLLCRTEFSKDAYRSIRYYAVILIDKMDTEDIPVVIESPEPKSRVDPRPTSEMIVLEPKTDFVSRPRFRVDFVEDTMICEEFELVCADPFAIRPINTDVWLTPLQLDCMRPVVLNALSNCGEKGMPVVSVVPDAEVSSTSYNDNGSFLIQNVDCRYRPGTKKLKAVIQYKTGMAFSNPQSISHTAFSNIDNLKRRVLSDASSCKKPKVEEKPNSKFCIDVSDEEDVEDDTIVIN